MKYNDLIAKHYAGLPVMHSGSLRFVIGMNDEGVFQCCDSSGSMVDPIDPEEMEEIILNAAPSKVSAKEKQDQNLFKTYMLSKGADEKLLFEILDDAEKAEAEKNK